MRITIAQRLKPFVHVPGQMCVLPGTLLAVRAFPTLAIVYDISGAECVEVGRHVWHAQGPVKDFTVQQDLEKGCIRVWGHAQNGFFRYRLAKVGKKYSLFIEKAPDQFGDGISVAEEEVGISPERLFLGVDKQQDWTDVKRRQSPAEIYPFWLKLGSMTPDSVLVNGGTAALLQQNTLSSLLSAGFEGLLFPRLEDTDHQGYDLPPLEERASPAVLLSEGAKLIRSLFFQQDGQELRVLPAIPHEFHSGRFIHVACDGGELDLEWRSRKLRRMVFRCNKTGEYLFVFPPKLKTFRLREIEHTRGVMCTCHALQSLVAGKTYFFDLFEI